MRNWKHVASNRAVRMRTCKSRIQLTGDVVSVKEVHADLFKLLMTGRSGPAVQEWLGNRLTGRVSVLNDWSEL